MEKFNLLIIGDANHQYILNFSKWLRTVIPNIVISIISTNPKINLENNIEVYDNHITVLSQKNVISKIKGVRSIYIRRRIIKIVKSTDIGSDAILVHFASSSLSGVSKRISVTTKNYIIALWGSDFYRTKDKFRLNNFFNYANSIVIGSPQMVNDFQNEFKEHTNKISLCFYGSEPIEILKKFKDCSISRTESCNYFNLSDSKINVTIGHNGSKAHQHIAVLKELLILNPVISNQIRVLLPMTYGLNKEYFKKIQLVCKELDFEYIFFTDFMDELEVAHLRNLTDIMINLQITDAFSGSMREVLYCGGVIINGSWLPYQFLKEKDIYYEEVDSVNQIVSKLNSVVSNYNSFKKLCENNPSLIYTISSWSHTIHNWKQVIEKE